MQASPLALAVSLVLPATLSAQIVLNQTALVDLDIASSAGSPAYVGTNPSAVAWDGADLFVAGFNNSTATNDVGIVKVTDALGAQTLGLSFGTLSTPGSRGYSGLDMGSGAFAAAYDDGGSDPNGITSWSTAGVQQWAAMGRGGSGVGLDPGFPGGNPLVGSGVGWTSFGSGRRSLQDAATGAVIFDSTNGMVILTGEGTFWRDMDYDPDTGDVWLREGNNVIQAVRGGDNLISSTSVVVDASPDADFVNGQNVAFLDRDTLDVVFYNDRSATGVGQDFFGVVKAVQPDGTPVNVDWSGFNPASGNGYYDFSWDRATGSLAILDFLNRNVYLFDVMDAPALTATPDQLSLAAGGTQTFTLSAGAAKAVQPYLLVGTLSGTMPGLPLDGMTLPINVDVYTVISIMNANVPPFGNTFGTLDVTGGATATFTLPAGTPASLNGNTLHHAYVAIDLGGPTPVVSLASNAVPLMLTP